MVPTIPASLCPGMEHQYWYVPGGRLITAVPFWPGWIWPLSALVSGWKKSWIAAPLLVTSMVTSVLAGIVKSLGWNARSIAESATVVAAAEAAALGAVVAGADVGAE